MIMFNLTSFIKTNVTERCNSMFRPDIELHDTELRNAIRGKRACVIGGAGSIGSAFISELLTYEPSQLVVVDLSENGLAELTRDLRSSGKFVPQDYRTYTLDFAHPVFKRIFEENKGFDIVANFSAHKHVRSERDKYSVELLLENNVIKAKTLLDLLTEFPPEHFFCVSTDKAANPVNIMGASKRILEDLIMAYSNIYPVTTARFANVAFSNGSLPDGWTHRLLKRQPLAAPSDVKRYFVSPQESGQICLLACVLGKSGEVFFPKLEENQMKTFSEICDDFVRAHGFTPKRFKSDEEARDFAATMKDDCREYPVVYSTSNTTGEKAYEEFYVSGETINNERFASLGVVEKSARKDRAAVDSFLCELKSTFDKPDFTKQQIVDAIKAFLPNFEHEEKGTNLDQKM